MYVCEHRCGPGIGKTTYYSESKDCCPRCGGKIIKEKIKDKLDKLGKMGKIYFHMKWKPQHMQVGLDKVYCPTRQSYLDACKHGRVMHAGTREISTREIDPVGAKD